jgi:hypothetical protein
VVTHGLLPGASSAVESVEPACRADSVDEYRDLAMLADAWERGALEPHGVEGGLGAVEQDEGERADDPLIVL